MEEAHPLPGDEAKGRRQFLPFPVLFQTVWPLFEPLAPLVAASPRWLLGCSPLPLPFPHPPHLSCIFISWTEKKDLGLLSSSPGKRSRALTSQRHKCTVPVYAVQPSPLSAFGETHRQIHAVSSLLPVMCSDLGGKKTRVLLSLKALVVSQH